jgi:hypothetical protein
MQERADERCGICHTDSLICRIDDANEKPRPERSERGVKLPCSRYCRACAGQFTLVQVAGPPSVLRAAPLREPAAAVKEARGHHHLIHHAAAIQLAAGEKLREIASYR